MRDVRLPQEPYRLSRERIFLLAPIGGQLPDLLQHPLVPDPVQGQPPEEFRRFHHRLFQKEVRPRGARRIPQAADPPARIPIP